MHIQRNGIACKTYLYNEFRRTLNLWKQTLLQPVISSTLYFLIFGKLLGQRMGAIADVSYVEFIIPGLLMMNMLNSAFHASVFVVFLAKFTKSIEEILVSPMHPLAILLSFMGAGIMRGLLVGGLVGGVSLCFTSIEVTHPVLVLGIAVLACSVFSALGVINGLYAKTFDDTMGIPTFVITPLSYLGGIFYSVSMLPPFWQKMALFNPLVYLIGNFRTAFHGTQEIPVSLEISLCFMIAAMLGLGWIGYRMIERRTGLAE